MRKFLIAAVAVSGLALAGVSLQADDSSKGKKNNVDLSVPATLEV